MLEFVRVSDMARTVPVGNLLMVAAEGSSAAEAESTVRGLLSLSTSCGAATTRLMESRHEWNILWDIRRSPFRHTGSEEYLLGEALDVPLNALRESLAAVESLKARMQTLLPEVRGYLLAHIGAGTLHPLFACPPAWDYDRRVAAASEIRLRVEDLKIQLNATVGEQGIFPQHARWFARHYGQEAVSALHALKQGMDPNNVLNPGRL